MGHNIKPGVATGLEVQAIFNHAKANNYALPAVNVIGSDTINGVLETARDLNAPVIIQFSNGGAHFFAGKSLSNEDEFADITNLRRLKHMVDSVNVGSLFTGHATMSRLANDTVSLGSSTSRLVDSHLESFVTGVTVEQPNNFDGNVNEPTGNN